MWDVRVRKQSHLRSWIGEVRDETSSRMRNSRVLISNSWSRTISIFTCYKKELFYHHIFSPLCDTYLQAISTIPYHTGGGAYMKDSHAQSSALYTYFSFCCAYKHSLAHKKHSSQGISCIHMSGACNMRYTYIQFFYSNTLLCYHCC